MINEPGFDDSMQATHDKIQWIMAPTAAEMIDDRMSVSVNWASNRIDRRGGPRYLERDNPLSSHSSHRAAMAASHWRATPFTTVGSRFASHHRDASTEPGLARAVTEVNK